jgi:hypothetical protein
MSLSQTEMRNLHEEANRVYYHPKIGLYTVHWIETGNNDIPVICPISLRDIDRHLGARE